MKKIELYILIIGLFLCGLVSSGKVLDVTLSSRHLIWAAITAILFFSISFRAIRRPAKMDFSILRVTVFYVFWGYLVFAILSFVNAVNISESLYQVLKIFVMIIYLFEVVLILREYKYDVLIKSLTILAVILSCYGGYQYFADKALYGTMSGRNLWSAAQLLLLPFCFYCLLTFNKKWWVISGIAIVMLLFNIIVLHTRSVWLAFFVSGFSLLCFRPKYLLCASLIFLVFAGSVYCLKDHVVPAGNLVNRIKDTQTLVERFQIWYATLKIYKDNFVLGVGAGNWKIVVPLYGRGIAPRLNLVAFKNVYYQRPHNDFLWVLSETGTTSFLFYISIFICSFYYLYKVRNRIAIMVFFGLVCYVVFAFFSFPMERTFHSMILMVFIAISISEYHKRRAHYFQVQTIYFLSVCALAVLSLATIDFWFRYDSERIVKNVVREKHFKRWNNCVLELEKQSWFSTLDPISTPLAWYKGEAEYMVGNVERALTYFEKANKHNPNHIFVLTNLGACQAILGQDFKAIENFKKALVLCPDFEGAKNNLQAVHSKLNGAELWPQKPK